MIFNKKKIIIRRVFFVTHFVLSNLEYYSSFFPFFNSEIDDI